MFKLCVMYLCIIKLIFILEHNLFLKLFVIFMINGITIYSLNFNIFVFL